MAKYKNIVGTGLLDYVQTQITEREQIVNQPTRTPDQLQWLTNRTGWFRLSSGVDFNPAPKPPITTLEGPGRGKEGPANLVEVFNPEGYSDNLAKQYVLQSGTVSTTDGNDINLKKGFSETYSQGETDKLGYKPMPGITGVKVGTGGRWQTLMQADIDFVCYDLDQLDIMTKLYMSLGTSLFLEWGHTPYIDNNGTLQKNIRPINFFSFDDKDELLQAITKKRQDTFGNYDGMVGTVYNFDYKSNNDGSYNCSVKLMGPGGMLESLKINGSINIDFDAGKNIEAEKYSSTLGNALYALHNYLSKRDDLFKTERIAYSSVGPSLVKSDFSTAKFGKIEPKDFFKGEPENNVWSGIEETLETTNWGELLNSIYSAATYNKVFFNKNNSEVEYKLDVQPPALPSPLSNFSAFGNAYQLVMGLKSPELNDGLNTIPTDFYSGYANILKTEEKENQIGTYITLGHLFALIQHIGVFTETKEGITLDASPDTSTCKPIVYLDYHPDNTEILTGPLECSVDPTKCLIPWSPTEKPSSFFAPLDIDSDSKEEWWGGLDKLGNKFKNFVNYPDKNKVNPVLGDSFMGKVFNILVNLKFAYTTLESLSNNEDKSVNLIEYVNAILDGINLSLGQVNNLRAFVGDDGKVLRIIDENVVEPLVPEKMISIPNFGLKSTVYDYGFSSKITPKLASQIVIAAQARDTGGVKQFSEDVLSYQSMNVGIVDRFSTTKLPAVISKSTKDNTGKLRKTYQKLYDHIYYCYSADDSANLGLKINSISSLINTFSSLQGIRKKTNSKTAGTALIPLEFNLTMDGLAGVLPYNAFLVPNNRLPKSYRNRVAFCVFSINHNLDDNRWTTTLRGQTILLDKPIYINTTQTIKATGGPALSPNSNLIGIDFPEQELIGSEVTIGSSNISNNEYSPKRLPPSDTTTISDQTTTETSTQTTTTQSTSTPDLDILAAIPFIKDQEGFESEPYPDPKDDPNGRLSIGYGSDTITKPDGSFYKITRKSRVTEQDAERDLIRRIKTEFRPRVIQRLRDRGVDYNTVDTKIQVVFIDLAYNYGTLFYDFVEAYKANGKQGVIEELNNRIERFDRGERGQVKTRRIAEKRYLGG